MIQYKKFPQPSTLTAIESKLLHPHIKPSFKLQTPFNPSDLNSNNINSNNINSTSPASPAQKQRKNWAF